MSRERNDIPLLIGEPSHQSIVNPDRWVEAILRKKDIESREIPERWIFSFKYTKALEILEKEYDIRQIELSKDYPIYIFEENSIPLGFRYIEIGAPMAGMILEETIALGGRYIIFFGGVGVLLREIKTGDIILPIGAIRDEGTSYHYIKPGYFAYPSKLLVEEVENTLDDNGEKYFKGIVWTTDAPFRETIFKRRLFIEKGAICVDMESSALFSIASFRGVELAGIFYGGDYVGEEWDLRVEEHRQININEIIKKLLGYSIETLIKIGDRQS